MDGDPVLLDRFMANLDHVAAIEKDVQDIAPGRLGNSLLGARDREDSHML